MTVENKTKDKRSYDVNATVDNDGGNQGEAKENDVQFDTLISSAGELGWYQLLMLFSSGPFHMFGVFVYYSQIFITEVPDHWCWVPELANLTDVQRRDLAIPKIGNSSGYSQCYAYEVNWTEVILTGGTPNETWISTPCQNGWEFDRSQIPYPTISSDFEWVCDKRSYQTKAQVIFFCGSFLGGITIGWVADRFGRIPAVIASNLLGCIGGFSSTFATNFAQFSICRFIMGMSYDTCMTMSFLIVLEYLDPKYRSIYANTTFAIFYSLFATTTPFIVLACGHWKTICLVTSLPLASAILTPLFFPESARWLLSKGRIDEAINKVTMIARRNNKEIPSKLVDQFRKTFSGKLKEEQVSVFEILKRPLLRRTMFLVCLVYMCCEIVFDGLIRNLKQIDFDFFLSIAASCATELPSVILCAFTMDFIGRRWMTFLVLVISSLCSILTIVVENGVPSLICAVVARFAVNMSYNIMLQWTAEILPTPIRGSGVSFIHICSNLGFIISTFLSYLKTYLPWLPFMIIGIFAGVGALAALAIPETAKKELPQTFEEADDLIRSWKMWEINTKRKKKPQGQVNQGFEM